MQNILIFCAILVVGILGQDVPSGLFQQGDQMSLSVPRSKAMALSVKNYAVIVGGILEDGFTYSDAVDVLDLTTRNIYQTKLEAARTQMIATSVGEYAIITGGYEYKVENLTAMPNVTLYPAVEVLDVGSLQWKRTPFPESFYFRISMSVTTMDNLAVFFNGTALAFFDPKLADGTAWTVHNVNTTGIMFRLRPANLVVKGTTIYAMDITARAFLAIDTSSFEVTNLASSGATFNAPFSQGFLMGEKIYFSNINTMLIYDTQEKTWSSALFPKVEMTSTVALPLQQKIFVSQTDAQFLYNPTTVEWYYPNTTIYGSASAVTVVEDKYAIIAGGLIDGNATASINVLEYKSPYSPADAPSVDEPTASTSISNLNSVVGSACLILSTFVFVLA